MLVGEEDFNVVGEAGTIAETRRTVGLVAPDVVVLDVNLPDGSGVDLCRSLTADFPSVVCLMLTSVDDDQTRRAAAAAGASGFLLKALRGPGLVDTVRAVVNARRSGDG
ncbi:hypothetical protein BH10ACT3_BH10ACT3_24330 [soil metagenome]